jgi:hypothetical protein
MLLIGIYCSPKKKLIVTPKTTTSKPTLAPTAKPQLWNNELYKSRCSGAKSKDMCLLNVKTIDTCNLDFNQNEYRFICSNLPVDVNECIRAADERVKTVCQPRKDTAAKAISNPLLLCDILGNSHKYYEDCKEFLGNLVACAQKGTTALRYDFNSKDDLIEDQIGLCAYFDVLGIMEECKKATSPLVVQCTTVRPRQRQVVSYDDDDENDEEDEEE